MADANTVLAKTINELPAEKLLGLDVDRTWATGVQVHTNPEYTILVFRDQTMLEIEKEGEETKREFLIKNVATIVLPTAVARELTRILSQNVGLTGANE